MTTKSLQLKQLNTKMLLFEAPGKMLMPHAGWIKTIRKSLGMSMQQLGNKLSVTKQSIQEIEMREKDGAITIKSLKELGKAMDLKLVYGFVPKDGSLDDLIERRANELAKKIVLRTAQTMKLEDQAVSAERLQKAIEERAESIKKEMPKILWD